MTRLRTTVAIVALLAAISSAHASGDPPPHPLDGKSFEGRLRGTGLLRLIGDVGVGYPQDQGDDLLGVAKDDESLDVGLDVPQ